MKILETCDLCGEKEFKFLFKNKDTLHQIDEEYDINQCKNCGLIFINPQPEGIELANHYPSDYYTFSAKTSKFIDLLYNIYYFENNPLKKVALLSLKPLVRTILVVKGGRCLDVGCGSGEFLRHLKRAGMDAYGVEPGAFDEKFVKENNLNVVRGTLIDAKFPSNYFDVITINHVFEHLSNPSETMEELSRILKPNGKLIIGVPQYKTPLFKVLGKKWIQLDTPRHLFVPSADNMKQYAQKAKFSVERVRYNMVPGSLFGFSLNKKSLTRKIAFVAALPFVNILNLLKMGDQIEIILIKK